MKHLLLSHCNNGCSYAPQCYDLRTLSVLFLFTSGHVRLCGTVTCQGSSSPSRQCSSTQVAFGLGFLSQEQCNNPGAFPYSPDLAAALSSTEISIEGTALLWYYGHQECDGRAEKVFIKWLQGMFPTHLQSLAEVHICTRGLFWRKYSVHDCIALYLSKIEWLGEHF
jgi:hypothetical protein